MNKKFKQSSAILIVLLLLQSTLVYSNPFARSETPKENKTLMVIDNEESTPLPNRFRIIHDLNMSGSKQFTPSQLPNIIKEINNPRLFIVDLRQESHGFINDMAVSYHNNTIYPFECLNCKDTLIMEKNLFGRIKTGDDVNLHKVNGDFIKTIKAETIELEPDLAQKNNVNYELFAVKDGSIPVPTTVDRFVIFAKNVPEGSHVHFHCKEGEGRTTTFMSMYQIMHNSNNLSLDEILQQQITAGGIDIVSDNPKRAAFVQQFYNYVNANKESNYSIPYSQWSLNETLAS